MTTENYKSSINHTYAKITSCKTHFVVLLCLAMLRKTSVCWVCCITTHRKLRIYSYMTMNKWCSSYCCITLNEQLLWSDHQIKEPTWLKSTFLVRWESKSVCCGYQMVLDLNDSAGEPHGRPAWTGWSVWHHINLTTLHWLLFIHYYQQV